MPDTNRAKKSLRVRVQIPSRRSVGALYFSLLNVLLIQIIVNDVNALFYID